jgi:MFS superfamily sulfate permease-like transporter
MKQLPHAFGYDSDFEGDQSFVQMDGSNTFSALFGIFDYIQLGSIIITVISLIILIAWDKVSFLKKLKLIPGALIAVIVGVVLNEIFTSTGSSLTIAKEHLVSLPVPKTFEEFKQIIVTPNFSGITNPKVWVVGLTIAIVASIETLLCIEASDRMDVQKRYTDTNVELKAQGIGNIISSLLGGLPMTSVVVRSSANNNAGAKSKMSAIIHGVLLLVSVVTIPLLLNKIPLATLAAILLLVGYKLAKPSTFKHFWEKGKYQFIPFIATLSAVVFTDLLKGVALGIVISIIFILRGNLKRAYYFRKEEYADGDVIHIDLAQEVSFLNKAAIKLTLNHIPENSKVIINAQDTVYIAHDILDLIHEFKTIKAKDDNIKVKLKGFKKAYQLENSDETANKVTVEHYYDAAKRKTIKKEIVIEEFHD